MASLQQSVQLLCVLCALAENTVGCSFCCCYCSFYLQVSISHSAHVPTQFYLLNKILCLYVCCVSIRVVFIIFFFAIFFLFLIFFIFSFFFKSLSQFPTRTVFAIVGLRMYANMSSVNTELANTFSCIFIAVCGFIMDLI